MKIIRIMTAVSALLIFCVSCAPELAKLKLIEGNVYFSRGKYAEAAGAYMDALDDAKTAPYAAYLLGSAYSAMGQDEAALARFDEAENSVHVRENRELVYRSRYNSGVVRFTNGDFAGAAADFKRALEVDGARIEAKLNFELSNLSLMRKNENAQLRTTQKGSVGEDDRRRESEILFNFVRQKEAERWKSWEFTGETNDSGLDY